MSMIEKIPERRVAPRAVTACRVYVTEPPAPTCDLPGDEELLAPLFGRAVNLSVTGVLVEVDEPLCLGRRVVVTLELDDGSRVSLRGRVARTTRVRGTALFRLGIGFEAPCARELKAIRDLIRTGITVSYLN